MGWFGHSGRQAALVLTCVVACFAVMRLGRALQTRDAGHEATRKAPGMQAMFSAATQRTGSASISGLVTDTELRPLAGARVCASVSTFEPHGVHGSTPAPCANTGPDGRYRIGDLAAGGYVVTARAPGRVPAAARGGETIAITDAVPRTGVDIVLEPGGARLAGTVLDAWGGPVPHAAIRAELLASRVIADGEADDEGRFELSFAPGAVLLTAQAPAYAAARWNGVAPSADVRLVLQPSSTLRGVVVSSQDGTPLPDIEVRAVPRFHRSYERAVLSGADGSFELDAIEAGSYLLTARGGSWHGIFPTSIEIGVAETRAGLRIEASPAAQIRGRVTFVGSERPCAEGVVRLGAPDPLQAPEQFDPGQPYAGDELNAAIEADGSVRFPGVPNGRYHVTVNCPGHVLREGPRTIEVPRDASRARHEWKVDKGIGLTVLAVDERHVPVPGAQLQIQFTPSAGPGLPLGFAGQTDGEGRYTVDGTLPPGAYDISATPPVEARPLHVELHAGDGQVQATLKLAGSGSIVATVRDRADGPTDGLMVVAVRLEPEGEGAGFIGTAIGDGRYRITPLEPGQYELRVDDGVNPTVRAGAREVFAGSAVEAAIELERAGRIRGRVVDENGDPVRDVWVSASAMPDAQRRSEPAASDLQLLLGATPSPARVLSDPDGRFSLDRLREGTMYTLRAEQSGGSAAVHRAIAPGAAEISITLPAAAAVSGVVVGSCGDDGPVMVRATNRETQTSSQQMSQRDGRFAIQPIAPGHIELAAFCSDHLAQASVELGPKQHADGLRLVLQPMNVANRGQSPQFGPEVATEMQTSFD